MPTFKDSTGKEWIVTVTVNTIRRVRDRLGIDLVKLFSDRDTIDKMEDVLTVANVVYVVVQDQCEKAGLTDEQFGERLLGDVLSDAAEAVYEALILFFPQSSPEDSAGDDEQRERNPSSSGNEGVAADRRNRREQPDWYSECLKLSAIAGVVPWDFTLRDLLIMGEG